MVKHENFKTCSQSGFCKRNRAYADNIGDKGSDASPYQLESGSITFKKGQLSATVIKTTQNAEKVRLPLTVSLLDSGVARVTVDEERRMKGDIELRHGSTVRKERYNEAADWAVVGGLTPSSSADAKIDAESGFTKVTYGPDNKFEAVIQHSPFEVSFQRDGQTQVQFNSKGFLNVEHWRPKPESDTEESSGQTDVDDGTWWEESFGGNKDSKPRGPESVGMDISFPGYEHVFGIPEHADSMSLKQTR